MNRKIILSAFLAMLALAAGAGELKAAPLAVYDDEGAWRAAVKGLGVGKYMLPVTYATTTTTIKIGGTSDCPLFEVCIVDSTVDTSSGIGLSGFGGDFSFASFCEFDPGCLITNTTKISLIFSKPISGFAAHIDEERLDTILQVNGLDFGSGCFCQDQFFGLVGPIKQLDFYADGFTDNDAQFFADRIVVAMPEPPTWALLIFSVLPLGLFFVRRKNAPADRQKVAGGC